MLNRFLLISLLILVYQKIWAEWSGLAAIEYRTFPDVPLYAEQNNNNASIILQPEFSQSMDNGQQLISFIPYYRYDKNDPERTHGDIRELSWVKADENWELRLGIRKVFWGVTEFLHLVDIINQSDFVENSDGEDKLGQPMLNLALIGDYGTLDLFILPYFRERTFPGKKGWPRQKNYVDSNQEAIYQSDKKEKHIDYATRWTKSIDVWDLGLSFFYGTSRDPVYQVVMDTTGATTRIPIYKLIHQAGIDLQATVGNWLWKLEAIQRSGIGEDYVASTAGFEYSFYGIAETQTDIGLVMEYMYDSRPKGGSSPFDDDVLVALRFDFNDVQSTNALIGVIKDRDFDTTLYSIEASRRIGNNWKLSLEARFYENTEPDDKVLYAIRDNDFVQVELAYYF